MTAADLAAIKAALAAAAPGLEADPALRWGPTNIGIDDAQAVAALLHHAPTWLAALVAEVERLNLPENRGIGDTEIVQALKERDRLRAALKRHGRHSDARGDDGSVLPPACDVFRWNGGQVNPCSCGLDAALDSSRKPDAELGATEKETNP